MIVYKTEKLFTEKQLKELFLSVNWLSADYSQRLVKAMENSDTVISAWDEDRLVGLANAMDDGELTAYICYLLVNPQYQKTGIGTEIVNRLKEIYKGYLYLILMAEKKDLTYFYEKMGFHVMDEAVPMEIQTF